MTVRPPSDLALTVDAELALRAREVRVTEHRLAVLLAQVQAGGLFREFGFAKLIDYAVVRHGLSPGRAKGLAQLGSRLAELPELDQALADGQLDWTKARHVARVATANTEAAWIEVARASTNRELEHAVRCSANGEVPAVVEPPDEEIRTLRLSRGEAKLFDETLQAFRARCGFGAEQVEDGPLVVMALQRLAAEVDPDQAPSPDRYRFVVEKGASTDSADPVVREAACDAVVVDVSDGPTRGHVTRTVPPATRRAVFHRDRLRCTVPGCTNRLWLDQHHVRARQDGGGHELENLVTLCNVHHRLVHEGRIAVISDSGGGFRFARPG